MKSNNDVLVVIPARYGSSRFPGKPLALLGGREVILHVCDRVASGGFELIVATDDVRIADVVTRAGYTAVMTDPNHLSGTDRVWEACRKYGSQCDVIINVQGDEPFINPKQIQTLAERYRLHPETEIATLASVFDKKLGFEKLADSSLVKVVRSDSGNALYFSRSVIPFQRGVEKDDWCENAEYLTHIGIYAYRKDILSKITSMRQTDLEKLESLEQLRWLQNGISIWVGDSESKNVGIDTPEDLRFAEELLSAKGN